MKKRERITTGLLKPLLSCSVTLACTVLLTNPVFSQQIITNGNTATSLNINGDLTTVTTSTIQYNNAFNSFSKFNVDSGKTVNLVVPNSADNLINTVSGAPSQINGVLKSLKNGQIGGNVYLLNPYGIVVGSAGRINTGSLTAITPTKDFIDNFYDSPGNPNPDNVRNLLEGYISGEPGTCIENRGVIKSTNGIALSTGSFINKGNIYAGVNGTNNNLAEIVNLDSVKQPVSTNKSISIQAGKVSIVSGSINAPDGSVLIGGNDIELTNEQNSSSPFLQLSEFELGRIKSKGLVIGSSRSGFETAGKVIGRYDISRIGDLEVLAENISLKNVNISGSFLAVGSNEQSTISAGNIFAGKNILIGSSSDLGNLKTGGFINIGADGSQRVKNVSSRDYVTIFSGFSGDVITENITAKNDINLSTGQLGGIIKSGNLTGKNIILRSVGENGGAITTKDICARGNVDLTAGIISLDPYIDTDYSNGQIITGDIKAGGNLSCPHIIGPEMELK